MGHGGKGRGLRQDKNRTELGHYARQNIAARAARIVTLAQTRATRRTWNPSMEEFEACPYCGSTAFHGATRGGYCQNVECARCGARFKLFLPFRDYPVILINALAGPRSKPH